MAATKKTAHFIVVDVVVVVVGRLVKLRITFVKEWVKNNGVGEVPIPGIWLTFENKSVSRKNTFVKMWTSRNTETPIATDLAIRTDGERERVFMDVWVNGRERESKPYTAVVGTWGRK